MLTQHWTVTEYFTVYGGDPFTNPLLATAVAAARRAGLHKASIEANIKRGQGVSADGVPLENMTLELLGPGSVAILVECQTESKGRLLQFSRQLQKDYSVVATPISFMFSKRGMVVFEKSDVGQDDILDDAIEAGATDLDTNIDGNMVVYSEPSDTQAVAKRLSEKKSLIVTESTIVWTANSETMVDLHSAEAAEELVDMLDDIRDESSVQAIYVNARQGQLDNDIWNEIKSRVET
jgi:transcriptional/translational regulatory protein YebC/TACO1